MLMTLSLGITVCHLPLEVKIMIITTNITETWLSKEHGGTTSVPTTEWFVSSWQALLPS